MSDRPGAAPALRLRPTRLPGVAFAACLTALVLTAGLLNLRLRGETPTPAKADDSPAARLKLPQWPADRRPLFVIPLTGQTFGYLQKCGCSDPQKGGLERRHILFKAMDAKGWEVVPIDLGDVIAPTPLLDQTRLKYRAAMESLQALGYRAAGLGGNEFALRLDTALSEFGPWKSDKQKFPRQYAVNLLDRDKKFPLEKGGSVVYAADLFPTKAEVGVGVTSLVGTAVASAAEKNDPDVRFPQNPVPALVEALDRLAAAEADGRKLKLIGNDPSVLIALYQGDLEGAKKLAAVAPKFRVVVCQSSQAEPPLKPEVVAHKDGTETMIIQVGHKGQNVGLLGVFRDANNKLELFYDKVVIDPVFETPAGGDAENPVLAILEQYAADVKKQRLVERFPKVRHPMQAAHPNAAYAGSESCKDCHLAEYNAWKDAAKHSVAFSALESAKRPSNRQFDGECVVCHTVGFNYQTGYDGTAKTSPLLHNVGCEVCHGPGSLHNAKPDDRDLYKFLSPWKAERNDRLPPVAALAEVAAERDPVRRNLLVAKLYKPAEAKVLRFVDEMCQKCHDTDNDPHYNFEAYWPKVHHTGLKKIEAKK